MRSRFFSFLARMLAVVTVMSMSSGFAYLRQRHFDVVIVGSTPAGISAALSAARRGLSVALVTRNTRLGGDLTDGMLTQWDLEHVGSGRLLETPLFHQFYTALPDGFSPPVAARYFERLVASQRNIEWFSGARDVRTIVRDTDGERRVEAIRFTSPSATRTSVDAPVFVDATDGGDIAAGAGARYDVGRQDQGIDERMQPVTLIFSLDGVDWRRVIATYDARRYGPGGAHGDQAFGYGRILRRYKPLSPQGDVPDANFQLQNDGSVMVNAVDVVGVDGRNPSALVRARAIAERESIHLVAFLRQNLPGFQRARVRRFAPALYVRETRHVRGLFWITASYIWDGRRPYDTVALGSYPIDVHPVDKRAHGGDGWAAKSHVYGIPLRAMVVWGFGNLAIVGPAISATHDAAGSLRVLPTTIAEGEAIGEACALSVLSGTDLAGISLKPNLVRSLRREVLSSSLR